MTGCAVTGHRPSRFSSAAMNAPLFVSIKAVLHGELANARFIFDAPENTIGGTGCGSRYETNP